MLTSERLGRRTGADLPVRSVVALAILAAASACTTFEDIALGECGNKVHERSVEDCDGFPGKATIIDDDGNAVEVDVPCGAPGTAAACRFTCEKDEDGVAGPCPGGSVCGQDGVCRSPSGTFETIGISIPSRADAMFIADFDGDGRQDLLVTNHAGSPTSRALFFEASGNLTATVELPGMSTFSVGQLTPDRRSDIAFAAEGLAVLRGQPRHSFSATSYSSFPLERDMRLMAFDAKPAIEPGDEWSGDELMGIKERTLYSLTKKGKTVVMDLPGGIPQPAVLTGQIDAFTPWSEFVVAHADYLEIIAPSKDYSGHVDWCTEENAGLAKIRPVGAGPWTIRNFWLTDLDQFPLPLGGPGNADFQNPLDLIIATDQGVFRSYGRGNGQFHSDEDYTATSNNRASLIEGSDKLAFEEILAIADLNGDHFPDFLTVNGLYLSPFPEDQPYFVPSIAPTLTGWTHASIADFNGDGRPDFITGSNYNSGVGYYVNAGDGLFNRFDIATNGPTDHFAIGDFDGDLLTDLVFAEQDGQGDGTVQVGGSEKDAPQGPPARNDWVSVLYGRADGAPAGPFRLGQLGNIVQTIAGRDLISQNNDKRSDVVVVSESEGGKRNLAIFPGRQDRNLQSPYVFARADGDEIRLGTPQWIKLGRFAEGSTGGRADVAALVQEIDPTNKEEGQGQEFGLYPTWLWFLPSSGEANLATPDPDSDNPTAMDPEINWSTPIVAAVPSADNAQDELLFFAAPADGSKAGAIGRARVVDERFVFEPTRLVDWTFTYREGSHCVADFDGDGRRDLVIVVQDADYREKLLFYWNVAGTGIDLDAPDPLELPGSTVQGGSAVAVGVGGYTDPIFYSTGATVACVRADRDGPAEVAVLGGDGVRVVNCSSAAVCEIGPPIIGTVGSAIAAGDLTGDGIDDIVISDANFGVTQLFKGIPVIR